MLPLFSIPVREAYKDNAVSYMCSLSIQPWSMHCVQRAILGTVIFSIVVVVGGGVGGGGGGGVVVVVGQSEIKVMYMCMTIFQNPILMLYDAIFA